MQETKTYELDLTQFMGYSPIPNTIRVRMALNKLGMKFADDGLTSSVVNKNPEPLGKVTWWGDHSKPNVRFYKQTLEVNNNERRHY